MYFQDKLLLADYYVFIKTNEIDETKFINCVLKDNVKDIKESKDLSYDESIIYSIRNDKWLTLISYEHQLYHFKSDSEIGKSINQYEILIFYGSDWDYSISHYKKGILLRHFVYEYDNRKINTNFGIPFDFESSFEYNQDYSNFLRRITTNFNIELNHSLTDLKGFSFK